MIEKVEKRVYYLRVNYFKNRKQNYLVFGSFSYFSVTLHAEYIEIKRVVHTSRCCSLLFDFPYLHLTQIFFSLRNFLELASYRQV